MWNEVLRPKFRPRCGRSLLKINRGEKKERREYWEKTKR